MRSLLLIINPVAGRGTYKNGLGEALHVLHSAGYVPTVRFTTHAGEAVELADQRFGRGEHVCADPAQQKAGDAQPVYADDKILIGLAEPVKAGLRGKKAVQQGRKQLENLAFQRVALQRMEGVEDEQAVGLHIGE